MITSDYTLDINNEIYIKLLGVFVRLSHSKTVYVMTRWHLERLKKMVLQNVQNAFKNLMKMM